MQVPVDMPRIMRQPLMNEDVIFVQLDTFIWRFPRNLRASEARKDERGVKGTYIERICEEDAAAGTVGTLARSQGFGSACDRWDAVNEMHFLQCVFSWPISLDNGFAAQSPDTVYSTVDHASQFGAVVGCTVFA